MIASFLARIEASGVATTIGRSMPVTGILSGLHLIGMTLLVGAVLVSTLRLMGVVLPHEPVAEVTRAARRGIVLGLALSMTTGLLLLSPRIAAASTNYIFQFKVLLLCCSSAAACCCRGLRRPRTATCTFAPRSSRCCWQG